MRYNQLGRTGLYVSELCLGAMTFGGGQVQGMWAAVGSLDQQTANSIVSRSIDAGINFIDTANVYHAGRSESIVGQSLKDLGIKRSDVVVATKVYGDMGPGHNNRAPSGSGAPGPYLPDSSPPASGDQTIRPNFSSCIRGTRSRSRSRPAMV